MNHKQTTDRFVSAKTKVRNYITDHASKIEKPLIITLCEESVTHEKSLLKSCKDAFVCSLNFNPENARRIERLGSKHLVVNKDIFQYVKDTSLSERKRLIWYDFCALKECWDGFFESVSTLRRDDVFYVTFCIRPRSWNRGKMADWRHERGIVQQFHDGKKMTDMDATTKGFYSNLRKRMFKLNWKPFYAVSYKTRGSRMITVGFETRTGKLDWGKTKIDFLAEDPEVKAAKIAKVKTKTKTKKKTEDYDLKHSIASILKLLRDHGGMEPKDFWKATSTSGKRAAISRIVNAG